uniref:ShKT domain-containing protein n=1 Tax=Plectus sambesii TaxID=2011161 RepID=A0A914X5G4_9BILA
MLSLHNLLVVCVLIAPGRLFAQGLGPDSTNVPLEAIKCFNQNSCCDYWGDLGKCASNDYMTYSCPATCKQCERSVPKSRTADYFPKQNCEFWVKAGQCINNSPWMSENCRFSCGLGNVPRENYCSKDPPPFECLNESPCCEKWVRENEGICNSTEEVKKKCRASCTGCKRPKYAGCADYYSVCEKKKDNGECKTDWMAENCRKSCGLCYETKEAHCVNPKNSCENEMADYSLCMKKNYGQTFFNSKQQIPFDDYECQLKECLSGCQASPLTHGCDRQKQGNGSVGADERLDGSVNTNSISVVLNNIQNSRHKALDCGLNTVRTVVQPKVEQCVRTTLGLSGDFRLHDLNLDEFLDTEKETDALEINARTYQLQKLVASLVDNADEVCEPDQAAKAKECVFHKIVNILLEIGNPTLHAYREQQNFCQNRTKCQNSLSAECLTFKDKIPETTSSCTLKLALSLKESVLSEYLQCLGRQKGFPPAISSLNKDPSVSKELSDSYEETLDSIESNLKEDIKDPCGRLFPKVEWDTVTYFDYDSHHTMVCSRTPKLTPQELLANRRQRQTRVESAKEKAMKSDICKSPDKYIAVPVEGNSAPLEQLVKNRNPRSVNDVAAARADGGVYPPLHDAMKAGATVFMLNPAYGGGGGGGGAAKPVFKGKG